MALSYVNRLWIAKGPAGDEDDRNLPHFLLEFTLTPLFLSKLFSDLTHFNTATVPFSEVFPCHFGHNNGKMISASVVLPDNGFHKVLRSLCIFFP